MLRSRRPVSFRQPGGGYEVDPVRTNMATHRLGQPVRRHVKLGIADKIRGDRLLCIEDDAAAGIGQNGEGLRTCRHHRIAADDQIGLGFRNPVREDGIGAALRRMCDVTAPPFWAMPVMSRWNSPCLRYVPPWPAGPRW